MVRSTFLVIFNKFAEVFEPYHISKVSIHDYEFLVTAPITSALNIDSFKGRLNLVPFYVH